MVRILLSLVGVPLKPRRPSMSVVILESEVILVMPMCVFASSDRI
jgi:hypothetical protein